MFLGHSLSVRTLTDLGFLSIYHNSKRLFMSGGIDGNFHIWDLDGEIERDLDVTSAHTEVD